MESATRAQKNKILVDEATGDEQKLLTDRIRLVRLNDEYTRYSKAAGLKTQRERAQVTGFGRGQNESKIKARVVNARKDATIERKEANGGRDTVQTIGKLNIEKYKCVTADITTDEVVITDERIAHIKERHPNDFERYRAYISQMIANPDYILEANRPDTAFLLKRFEENGEHFELIVRLKTSKDAENYKNSVITFLKVDEKRYKRYLRTKNVLYSAE